MKNKLCLLLVGIFLSGLAQAEGEDQICESHSAPKSTLGDVPKLICMHEPNMVGLTKDSDDRAFLDFKLSIRTQILPGTVTDWLGSNSALYFAFTGRFAQYLLTRESSPVVGKRFNPQFFFRHWYTSCHGEKDCPDSYVDFILAHESNGQSINNLATLNAAKASEAAKQNGNAEFAYDQLSRGWDYVAVKLKSENLVQKGSHLGNGVKAGFDFDLSSYVGLKYFLKKGPFQGESEQFDPSWETDSEGKLRNRVDGLDLMVKGIAYMGEHAVTKYAMILTTGYVKPFHYNTVRLEFGFKIRDGLPFNVWYQDGYNSDLAQYYKKVRSVGVNYEFGSF